MIPYLPDSRLRSIGNYSFSLGTSSANRWEKNVGTGQWSYGIHAYGFQIALGGSGDDELGALAPLQNKDKTYWRTPILSGGKGSDTYQLGLYGSVIISDSAGAYDLGYDTIKVPVKYSEVRILKINNRDILATDGKNLSALLLDPAGVSFPGNAIERISFSDVTIYASDIRYAVSSSYYPNYSYPQLESLGAFDLSVVGLDSRNIDTYIRDSEYNNQLLGVGLYGRTTADSAGRYLAEHFVSGYRFGDLFDFELTAINSEYYVSTSSHSFNLKPMRVIQAGGSSDVLDVPQIDFSRNYPTGNFAGSIVDGGPGNDVISGKAGWDVLGGGEGNDLIHGGNGRDILTGGLGADELHGDFGWNTYSSEKDGFRDLIAIKSDQYLTNWLYGKSGNNADGEKADVIEGLDSYDQIIIIGVFTSDISFRTGASVGGAVNSRQGATGIGIYAKGVLEAIYSGGDLTVAQIAAMTTGDASAAAMNNQINSYGWTSFP